MRTKDITRDAQHVASLRQANQRFRIAEHEYNVAQSRRTDAIHAALNAGVTHDIIAASCGVTRQAVVKWARRRKEGALNLQTSKHRRLGPLP